MNRAEKGAVFYEAELRHNTLGPYVYFRKWSVEKVTECGAWLVLEPVSFVRERIWRKWHSRPGRRFQPSKKEALQDLKRRRSWYADVLQQRARKVQHEVAYLEREIRNEVAA